MEQARGALALALHRLQYADADLLLHHAEGRFRARGVAMFIASVAAGTVVMIRSVTADIGGNPPGEGSQRVGLLYRSQRRDQGGRRSAIALALPEFSTWSAISAERAVNRPTQSAGWASPTPSSPSSSYFRAPVHRLQAIGLAPARIRRQALGRRDALYVEPHRPGLAGEPGEAVVAGPVTADAAEGLRPSSAASSPCFRIKRPQEATY